MGRCTKGKPKVHADYLAKYERVGEKPLGAGRRGTAWKVKIKGDDSGRFYVGKEFTGPDEQCKTASCPEATALKIVDNPGCVKLHETFGDGESGSVLVIEFLDGCDLLKVVSTDYKGKCIEKDKLIDWCLQMARAMRYIHKELYMIHRDLHLGNWMVLKDGTIKMIDFGLSLVLGEEGVLKRSWVYGPFMSPECYDGKPCGFDHDLWYFAGTLYCLVHPMHYMPFTARPMTVTNIPDILRAMIEGQHCVSRRKPFRPLPAEVSEYSELFSQCFDYDMAKRPDIDGIITALEAIKSSYGNP